MSESNSSSLPELIDGQEGVYKQRRRRRRRGSRRFRWARRILRHLEHYNWRIMLLLIVSVLAVAVMSGLLLASTAQSRVNDSWERLDRQWTVLDSKTGTQLTLADFQRLRSAVVELGNSLNSAQRQTVFLRPFTFVDPNWDVSLRMLDASINLTAAANDILAGMEPALFYLSEGEQDESVVSQISSGERIVELLNLGQGRFLQADRQLSAARQIIDTFNINNISPDLLITVEGLVDYHQQLREINAVLLDSPSLLTNAFGLNETKTYLILSQNSDELRPSGGFISTYGWITVRNGRIIDFDYSASTATSPNPPPVSLSSEVDIPDWWLPINPAIYAAWDASWYPDFPSTAAMAAWYYDQGGNPQSPVDGVISVDIVGFEYILKALGKVDVPSYSVTVDSSNFRAEVYRIRADSYEHKQFLAVLYRHIIDAWQAADQQQSIDVRGALLQALQEKHIMIYFVDESLNAAADELGWSGRQKSGRANDYILVADSNLGNKANRSVIRQLTYDARLQADGSAQGQLSIAYDYSARVAAQDPAVAPQHGTIDYNSLLQVFVPANSALIRTTNLSIEPTSAPTLDHTIFISRIGIKYNESQRYQFSYETPPLVERLGSYYRYRLILQKQPGTLAEVANVTIALPANAQTVSINPQPVQRYQLDQEILEFRLSLKTDQTIEIIYQQ